MEYRGLIDLSEPPSGPAAEWLDRLVPADEGPGHAVALPESHRRRRPGWEYDGYTDPACGAAVVRELHRDIRPWPLVERVRIRWAAALPVHLPAEPGARLAEVVFDFDGGPESGRFLLWVRDSAGRIFPAPESDPARGGGRPAWGPGAGHGIGQAAQVITTLWRDFGAAVDAHEPYPDPLAAWLAQDLRPGYVLRGDELARLADQRTLPAAPTAPTGLWDQLGD